MHLQEAISELLQGFHSCKAQCLSALQAALPDEAPPWTPDQLAGLAFGVSTFALPFLRSIYTVSYTLGIQTVASCHHTDRLDVFALSMIVLRFLHWSLPDRNVVLALSCAKSALLCAKFLFVAAIPCLI